MWWDVGWVRWGQEAAKGFLAPDEQVRTVFPAWCYLDPSSSAAASVTAVFGTTLARGRKREQVVVLLTDRDLYVIRESGSSRYLDYGLVLLQYPCGSFDAGIGRDGRHEVLVIDRYGIYFNKDQADGVREVIAASTGRLPS